jgi:hypothetical protein
MDCREGAAVEISSLSPGLVELNISILVVQCVRATLSLVWGAETSGGIQSINSYTGIQEWKYYAPSGGIQREERMRIPMLGAALKTKLASSTCPD